MKSVLRRSLVLLAAFAGWTSAWAGDPFPFTEEFYSQRIEGVTVTAGNAGRANAAAHIIDPWPTYAKRRHISHDAPRFNGVIHRYKSPSSANATGSTGDEGTAGKAGSGEAASTTNALPPR